MIWTIYYCSNCLLIFHERLHKIIMEIDESLKLFICSFHAKCITSQEITKFTATMNWPFWMPCGLREHNPDICSPGSLLQWLQLSLSRMKKKNFFFLKNDEWIITMWIIQVWQRFSWRGTFYYWLLRIWRNLLLFLFYTFYNYNHP